MVSNGILKALEGRGWIDEVGHREVPGRPALYSTTRTFLDDLNLRSLDELPALEDLGSLVESEADTDRIVRLEHAGTQMQTVTVEEPATAPAAEDERRLDTA